MSDFKKAIYCEIDSWPRRENCEMTNEDIFKRGWNAAIDAAAKEINHRRGHCTTDMAAVNLSNIIRNLVEE